MFYREGFVNYLKSFFPSLLLMDDIFDTHISIFIYVFVNMLTFNTCLSIGILCSLDLFIFCFFFSVHLAKISGYSFGLSISLQLSGACWFQRLNSCIPYNLGKLVFCSMVLSQSFLLSVQADGVFCRPFSFVRTIAGPFILCHCSLASCTLINVSNPIMVSVHTKWSISRFYNGQWLAQT